EAVLLRHAVEAPRVVLHVVRQVEPLLHPVAAPWSWVEERGEAKWSLRRFFERMAVEVACDEARASRHVGIEVVIDAVEDRQPLTIGCAPVDEVRTLVELPCRRFGIRRSEVADCMGTLALLDLPTGEIRVDED